MIKWVIFLIFSISPMQIFSEEDFDLSKLYLSLKMDLMIREGTIHEYEGMSQLDSFYWFAKGEVSMLQRVLQQIEFYENKAKDLKMELRDNNN
jgi:hypothetical protein